MNYSTISPAIPFIRIKLHLKSLGFQNTIGDSNYRQLHWLHLRHHLWIIVIIKPGNGHFHIRKSFCTRRKKGGKSRGELSILSHLFSTGSKRFSMLTEKKPTWTKGLSLWTRGCSRWSKQFSTWTEQYSRWSRAFSTWSKQFSRWGNGYSILPGRDDKNIKLTYQEVPQWHYQKKHLVSRWTQPT